MGMWGKQVHVGDVIVSVDGHVTAGLPVPDVVKKMKGPPGTQVRSGS